MGGRFVEGRSVEGCLVEGRLVGRTFCSGGRFLEGRFVLVPVIHTCIYTESVDGFTYKYSSEDLYGERIRHYSKSLTFFGPVPLYF